DIVGWALVLLAGPMIVIMANLAHGFGGRVEHRPSPFPPRLFVLPSSSLELGLVPLVFGPVVVVLAVVLVTAFVLPACAAGVALLAAAALAWLQGVCWMPFPLPWLRLILVCLTFPLLFFAQHLPPGVAEGVLLGATVAGYALAIAGVSLARYGTFVSEAAPAV